jgi:cytochrome b involved in lipid metabolism
MGDHPGGKKVILAYAGRDASEEFNALHSAFPCAGKLHAVAHD